MSKTEAVTSEGSEYENSEAAASAYPLKGDLSFRVEVSQSASEGLITSSPTSHTLKLFYGGQKVGVSNLRGPLLKQTPTLVVTDGDSTLIQQEVIDELAKAAGVGEEVAAITDAAMQGHLDFSDSLGARVALLEGAPSSILDEARDLITLTPGAVELVEWTHSVGARFGVVSGGFAEVLAPLASALGIDYLEANHLEIKDGRLTGRLLGPVVDSTAKTHCLELWSAGVPESAVAVGDGANDIPMLKAAGLGIAFCAKPAVRQQVASYLEIPRLDAVIKLLGY